MKNVNDSKGSVFYGMHMVSGCAEYAEPDTKPFRVYVPENTIRNMGPSFTGRPVYVYHVDEVEKNLDKLRGEVDGWVIESFFNEKDGKHWVKFLVVSEKGEQAIRNGMRLSNCYLAKSYGNKGTWNGISYDKEVTSGEYDHLAIVPNPRYEESIILSPEEFKSYNEDHEIELKRLANDKQNEGVTRMKFNIFKRAKVENSSDILGASVELPKSKIEVSIEKLINDADELELSKDKPKVARLTDFVKVGEEKLTVEDLIEKYENAKEECDEMKKNKKSKKSNEDDMDDEDSDDMENAEDEEEEEQEKDSDKKDPKEKKMNKKKKKNSRYENDSDDEDEEDDELEAAAQRRAEEKRKNAIAKAKRLKNAHLKATLDDEDGNDQRPTVNTVLNQINRGKELLGSGK